MKVHLSGALDCVLGVMLRKSRLAQILIGGLRIADPLQLNFLDEAVLVRALTTFHSAFGLCRQLRTWMALKFTSRMACSGQDRRTQARGTEIRQGNAHDPTAADMHHRVEATPERQVVERCSPAIPGTKTDSYSLPGSAHLLTIATSFAPLMACLPQRNCRRSESMISDTHVSYCSQLTSQGLRRSPLCRSLREFCSRCACRQLHHCLISHAPRQGGLKLAACSHRPKGGREDDLRNSRTLRHSPYAEYL